MGEAAEGKLLQRSFQFLQECVHGMMGLQETKVVLSTMKPGSSAVNLVSEPIPQHVEKVVD